ncbi:hypothetical protein BV898_19469 [Hypsibius exemplaris]|uniref:Uncharacterized protein n=1 Tax=Hypsibius exemplaris TaxID=2072580 RepID=A0A9X6RNZ3_HYPEX|nr:hypothetical protein BV898_19469 [Hypsibius exemplaris]
MEKRVGDNRTAYSALSSASRPGHQADAASPTFQTAATCKPFGCGQRAHVATWRELTAMSCNNRLSTMAESTLAFKRLQHDLAE